MLGEEIIVAKENKPVVKIVGDRDEVQPGAAEAALKCGATTSRSSF
jgi:antitoxin (DNA-binding transcriptional repressor) of toxin-antitoxin stability system